MYVKRIVVVVKNLFIKKKGPVKMDQHNQAFVQSFA